MTLNVIFCLGHYDSCHKIHWQLCFWTHKLHLKIHQKGFMARDSPRNPLEELAKLSDPSWYYWGFATDRLADKWALPPSFGHFKHCLWIAQSEIFKRCYANDVQFWKPRLSNTNANGWGRQIQDDVLFFFCRIYNMLQKKKFPPEFGGPLKSAALCGRTPRTCLRPALVTKQFTLP